MSAGNPIQISSRTYLTALADINSDPLLADKPDWFKRMSAGVVDVASAWENAGANNGYLRTCMTRRALIDVTGLVDYNPLPQISASGTEVFDLSPAAIMPYTVTQVNLGVNGPSSFGQSALRYGPRSSLTFNSLIEAIVQSTGVNTTTGALQCAASPFGYMLGEAVQLSSTGTLPTGLQAGTTYYVTNVNSTSYLIYLSTSRALALAGAGVVVPSATGTGTMSVTRLSRSIPVYQETDVTGALLGTADGLTPWQTFQIPQVGVQSGTLVVTVNGVQWTLAVTLALSTSTGQVYRLYFNTDGTAFIKFGNGTFGQIPLGAVVASYSYGGGSKSNISTVGQLSAYAGGDSNVTGCYNLTVLTGGSDPETFASAQNNAPAQLKARSRFVTAPDGAALAMSLGGLAFAQVNSNVFGLLSSQVVAIANGGGSPSPALQASIVSYLESVSLMGAVTVYFGPQTLSAVVAALNVHVAAGYSFSMISPYVTIAVKLFFSETGQQIVGSFNSGGIASAVTLINTIFGTSFAAADYTVISVILTEMNLLGVGGGQQSFGNLVEASDFYAVVESVPGVAYTTLTSCTIGLGSMTPSTGYQCAAAEIPTMTGGSVTLTQV